MKTAAIKIEHEQRDVTDNWRPYIKSLSITDARGRLSDTCRVVLNDSKQNLALIDTKSWLNIYAGYVNDVRHFGSYQCNNIVLDEVAGTYTITATAADFRQSLMAPASATYEGETVTSLTMSIAQKHGYQAKIHPSLSNQALPHIDQTGESDMAMLRRVLAEFDAMVKPLAGFLVVKPAALTKTLNDNNTYQLNLVRGVDDFQCVLTIEERQRYNSVKASWFDETSQQQKKVVAGSGEPVFELSAAYTTQESAQHGANAKYQQLQRQKAKLTINLPGTPDMVAEAEITISNHREGYNGVWVAESVTHELGGGVFTTSVTATLKA